MINKHLSHEDDIDVGKDEQIVEIERKLSMRMRMLIKLKRLIWGASAMRMVMRNGTHTIGFIALKKNLLMNFLLSVFKFLR